MLDLQLIGVHPDEEHLLLMTPDGQRYRLAIDDALRAAVRRDRSALGQIQSSSPGAVRPRDIQAQIRAGHSAEQVAKAAGISVDHVRRYEGPVLAERTHLCAMVLRHRLHGDGPDQGRELGEVVAERLMSRDVRDEPEWDSWRQDDGKWLVQLSFRAGTKSRKAQWTYHASKQKLEPVDDEARWFVSGTQAAAEQLAAPVAAVPNAETAAPAGNNGQSSAPANDPASSDGAGDEASSSWASTEALLSHLNAQRGVRPNMADSGEVAVPSAWQEVDVRDDHIAAPPPVHEDEPHALPAPQITPAQQVTAEHAEPATETTPAGESDDTASRHLTSVPVVAAADEDPDDDDQRDFVVVDETPTPDVENTYVPQTADEPEEVIQVPEETAPAGKRRSSVPTWDEIMFGSRRKD